MLSEHYNTKFQPVIGFNGKTIGYTNGYTLKKDIRGSKHLLKTPPAIAIDADAFDNLSPNIQSIEVHDTEAEKTYTSTVNNFKSYRIELDRGFGRQYALTLNRWTIDGSEPLAPFIPPETPKQLAFAIFFGGFNV